MEIQEIEKQKMDALRALSETNLEVSKVKNVLATLKSDEQTYIKEREEKVLDQIRALLDESREITKEALQNYEIVYELSKNAKVLSKFLVEAHTEFTKLVEVFEERTKDWEDEVKGHHQELQKARNELKIERTQIENEYVTLAQRKVEIGNQERKIRDQRETLERALNRLKK